MVRSQGHLFLDPTNSGAYARGRAKCTSPRVFPDLYLPTFYQSNDWRIFIDSFNGSLKYVLIVLIHN